MPEEIELSADVIKKYNKIVDEYNILYKKYTDFAIVYNKLITYKISDQNICIILETTKDLLYDSKDCLESFLFFKETYNLVEENNLKDISACIKFLEELENWLQSKIKPNTFFSFN